MKRSAYGVAACGAALVGALLLTGCGGSDGGRDDAGADTSESAPSTSASSPGPTTSTPTPTPSSPAPTSPAPTGELLVTVTVGGGFDGRHQSMLINGDGSYTTLSHRPERPDRKARMKPAEFTALRTALAESDFAKLPRRNLPEQPVADGLTTVVVYQGHEVATADGAKPLPELDRVIAALPPMDAGT